jgi:hypothetical protein
MNIIFISLILQVKNILMNIWQVNFYLPLYDIIIIQ